MASNYPFVLIDGSSYFYRAFHALPPLSNSKGQPTGAVYGVINMIKRLIKDYSPEYLAVVFDAKGKTFRDELFPDYKATRPPMPDDLRSQFKPMIDILEAMGLPLLIVEGVEADDVIGTLAIQAAAQKMNTLISTGDKDMAQLVDDHTHLINTMSNKLMDATGVHEKFGVGPELIIDYLTLIGDKVDNVPGVDKVGPKTAIKWLNEYGNLDGVMDNADNIGGKVGENLRQSLDFLPLSKKLVTIKADVELPVQVTALTPVAPNTTKLIEHYKNMEFKTWLNDLLGEAAKDKAPSNYETILSQKNFESWLKKIKQASVFAFDTETTALNAMDAKIVGVSFALQPHEAAYVPFGHIAENSPNQLDCEKTLNQLKSILEDPKILKVCQNAKYDKNVLRNHNIELQGCVFDTMLESYILNSSASRHDMDTLALKYLGEKTVKYEDIAGKGAKQLGFNEIPVEQAAPYAAEDADITLRLHEKLWPEIMKEPGLKNVFETIEMPLVQVLANIERNGVLIDGSLLNAQSKTLAKQINLVEKKIFEIAGEEFNINSTKQLQHILFEKLSLPITQKTPKGAPSTAESVLSELAYDYPLPKHILAYRSLTKLKSTYVDALPRQVIPHTGRIHTSYNQAVTSTGRLSSTEPNLQNIPVRTEEGRHIRRAFIAPKGYHILAADYSQIELRIMAHISGDKGLLKAFADGLDIHKATASEVFGVSLDDVTPEQRRRSKAINFGLIYGMSAFGLSRQIDVGRDEAQAYMDMYFERYPGVASYMDDIRARAHDTGYVETIFGRRLYLPEINARNFQRQRAAERTAINGPMQGSAADIIKKAMIAIDTWLHAEKIDARMIMQVHDELVFEVASAELEVIKKHINYLMSHTVTLKVPVLVDIGTGENWEEAH